MIQETELEKVTELSKKAYQSPTLTEWGTLNDLTQGSDPTGFFDADLTGHNPTSFGHV